MVAVDVSHSFSDRMAGRARRSLAGALILAALGGTPAAAAIAGRLQASQADGFGRIIFDLNQATKATTQVSNGILVISFGEPVALNVERLPLQLPDYIGVARLDPDGRAVRLALKQGYQVNLLDAGEKLFVDLLPPNWAGLPPGLPQDVIDALARRALKAEDALRKVQFDRARRVPKDIAVRVATGPGFSRIVIPVKPDVAVDFNRTEDGATLTVDSALRFDARVLKPDLPPSVREVGAELRDGMLEFALLADRDTEIRGFREDDAYVIDVIPPAPAKPKPAVAASKPEEAKPPAAKSEPAKPEAAKNEAARNEPAKNEPAKNEPSKPQQAAVPAGPVVPVVTAAGEGVRVTLSFAAPVAAAAFQRGGTLWLVFEDRQVVQKPVMPEAVTALLGAPTVETASGAVALRLPLNKPAIVSLTEQGATWIATINGDALAAAQPLVLMRGLGPQGRTTLNAKLANTGAAHWLKDPEAGDSIAVVTARGPVQATAKRQAFLELTALQTAHGLALVPNVDDLVISAGLDEVTIGRAQGMMLSASVPPVAQPAKAGAEAQLDPDVWTSDQTGSIREKQSKLMQEAADAPRRERSEARLRLARFLLANGFYPEAKMVLATIAADDDLAGASKPVLISSAMADILGGRLPDGEKTLASPVLALDSEAVLWRAVLDARRNHWPEALVGFRKSADVLEAYPDGLKALIDPIVIDAALNGNDPVFAGEQLARLDNLKQARVDPGVSALEHGRVAAANGRDESAMEYLQAAARGNREVEASARLELVLLKLKTHKIETADAIAELETIGAIWRRGDVEAKSLATLGDLYAAAGRWRDAFAAAQRATQVMPDHPLTRGLQDKMARAFSAMFIDGQDKGLSKIEALAVYYDFKEFTPPGRDGDEMIRHLADRLVDLDLLDQASALLQHQVEHRLEGVAKAQVAARLAVIDLMNSKPGPAVQVLRDSRLADVPAELKRARSLLEARALSEMSLVDLAVEILAPQKGEDADRLRADILWRGKRWREAGEAFELVLGDRWQKPEPLSAAERLDVLRAGIGYVLANERIGLDRLRSKYSAKMSDSADARTFGLVVGDGVGSAQELRELARTVISIGTLPDFLDSFRKRYPEIAGPKPQPPAEGSETQPLPPPAEKAAAAGGKAPA